MKAIVTKAFSGRLDNAPLPRMIAVGEEIEGDLADVAVREGLARDSDGAVPEEPAAEAKPKKKAGK